MACKHCRPKPMTPEEFKKTFKVGDKVCGWVTRKVVTITAIGEERFLYREGYYGSHQREGVATMCQAAWRWEKAR